ncbi:MAG: nuclear transport factor 2 family protein [Alphaproteobacteria bacterium]|nr:nuclear transport factor 2 family protein [Alphaproteobacteria bacterium]MBR1649524.1 nuclear transport factor 2 family protein [Alphaproteobacteria bacterium]
MLKKILFMLAIFGMFAMPGYAADINANNGENAMTETSVKDYEAVKAALNKYLEAGKQGKSDIMKPAFLENAIMYTSAKGEVSGGAIQGLYDYIDANPAAPEIEAEITAIDIAGTVAYARVESNNWHGARFSDMFLLLKDGNEWKILTKVYYTH